MKVAVAGGTGAVGRLVVSTARTHGHEIVVLTRADGVDLLSGAGLAGRLAGVDAVIDVTSTGTLATRPAVHFFGTVTDNLLSAERDAGVPHHIALSIIGAADADFGYYAGKAVQERKVEASAGGWSLLRASQFHEFAAQTIERGAMAGVLIAPRMRSQPVDAAEVAAALVRIVEAGPSGRVPDLGGPEELFMPDMVRRYARAVGKRNPVLAVSVPGRMGRAMRDGSLLPGPGAALGTQTFDEWLAAAVAGRPHP